MGAPAEEFAVWLEAQGRAANTVASYRRDVAGYLHWLHAEGVALDAVTGAELEAYLARLGEDRRPSSVARALAALRAFHRWCEEMGWAAVEPTHGVASPRRGAPAPGRTLGEVDIRRVVVTAAGSSAEALRDRALLLLLYRAGAKATEASAADVSDVDLEGGVVLDRGGPHHRRVPLVGDAAIAMQAWLADGRPHMAARTPALFVNHRGRRLTRQGVWLRCREAGERAGAPHPLGPEDLRRACRNGLLARGVAPEGVAALLGTGPGEAPNGAELAKRGWGAEYP